MSNNTLLLLAVVAIVLVSTSSSASSTPVPTNSNPPENNTKGTSQDAAPKDMYLQLLELGAKVAGSIIVAGKTTSEGR